MNLQDFQFGLRNSKIVHITEVESGLNCNCYCPCCGGRFVAYKGKVLRPHFKHQAHTSCRYSFETSLHYLAKEIIQEKKYLDMPLVKWILPGTPASWFSKNASGKIPPLEVTESQRIYFDKVELEKWEGNFIPDIKCSIGNKQLLIEITVTHGIDENKLAKIKSNDVPLLEINLSILQHAITKKTLAKALYRKTASANAAAGFKWIHNPRNNKLGIEIKQKSDSIANFLKSNQRHIKLYGRNKEIYNCPIREKKGIPYKYFDTCEYCNYNLGKTDLPGKRNDTQETSTDRAVICIGHKKYELQKLFTECGVNLIE